MHKCTNCGHEFDSKFCPECGTKWQEEHTCPNCGKISDGSVRFCPDCGYSFYGAAKTQDAESRKTEKDEESKNDGKKDRVVLNKVYPALRYIPPAAFALFAVLMFAFFAAPVAVMPGIFGTPSVSYGNFYSGVYTNVPEITWAAVILITLAIIAALYAVIINIVAFMPTFRLRKRKITDKALNIITLVLYAAIFVFSLAVIIQLSVLDGGTGLLKTGACPICIMVFSAVFAAVTAVSVATGYVAKKLNIAAVEKEASIKKEYLDNYYAITPKPRKPETVPKPTSKTKKTRLRYVPAITFAVFVALIFIAYATPLEYDGSNVYSGLIGSRYGYGMSAYYVCIPLIVVAFCAAAYAAILNYIIFQPTSRYRDHETGYVVLHIIMFLFYIVYLIFGIGGTVFSVIGAFGVGGGVGLICPIMIFVSTAAAMLISIVTLVMANRDKNENAEVYKNRDREYVAYSASRPKTVKYECEKSKYERAVNTKTSSARVWFNIHKWQLFSTVVLLTAAILVASIMPSVLTNKFRTGIVTKLEVGDYESNVKSLLGRPDESAELTWYYYDGGYMSVKNKLEKNQLKQEKALFAGDYASLESLVSEEKELKEKLNNITYKCIEIKHDEYKVTSIFLDMSRCDAPGSDSKKTVKKFNREGKIYTVKFKDGSYYQGPLNDYISKYIM